MRLYRLQTSGCSKTWLSLTVVVTIFCQRTSTSRLMRTRHRSPYFHIGKAGADTLQMNEHRPSTSTQGLLTRRNNNKSVILPISIPNPPVEFRGQYARPITLHAATLPISVPAISHCIGTPEPPPPKRVKMDGGATTYFFLDETDHTGHVASFCLPGIQLRF